MARTPIVFKQPAQPVIGGPVHIVFGATDGPAQQVVALQGAARVTGFRHRITVRTVVQASGAARVARLRGVGGTLNWDANVSRGGVHVAQQVAWQEAAPERTLALATWQESAPVRVSVTAAWQEAHPLTVGAAAVWAESERVRSAVRGHWQEAVALRAAAQTHWQESVRLRALLMPAWQDATPVRAAVRQHWQEQLRLRAAVRGHWQESVAQRVLVSSRFGDGVPLRETLRPHWQEAMRPRPGVSQVQPPVQRPCYVPAMPVHMVFKALRSSGMPLSLIFKCDGHRNVLPPPRVVVPARRSYVVINSIEVRRADGLAGDPLPSESFQMSLNRQSWTWTFSGTFHAAALDALMPGLDGEPVELEVRVNGQPFRLQAERVGGSRRLPEHLVNVSGRGKAALLDAPHAPVQSFSNTMGVNANQLMTDVLTMNGVGFGWSVDWNLSDWLVPAGAWMHQGTWISALADVAGAVGGYLQPHDTDSVLRVLPAWPKPWWDWDQLAVDIDLPEGFSEVDSTEVMDYPAYDRIFVSGEAHGHLYDLTRPGKPGTVLKPMAVHPLITDLTAARQRAIAEVSESGRMLLHRMELPVSTWTGVIKPGTVLEYSDHQLVRRKGIVRSTSLAHQLPVLTQSLEVESHV